MPAAAIVAVTIGSFLNLVLPKLYDAVDRDLQADVESISEDMKFIHACFRDLFKSPVPTTQVQEEWLKEMILLAYDIEDTTGCFLCNFMPRDQHSQAAGFLSRALNFAMRKMTPLSIQIGRKVRQLKKKSKDLRDRFVPHKDAVPAKKEDGGANGHVTGERKDLPMPNESEKKLKVISGENKLSKEKELLELVLLKPSESEKKKLKVISVAGYGALGNTRLVDNVLNDHKVQNRFPPRWIRRINATGKKVGLVIDEISAQVNRNHNGGSTSNMGKATEEHQQSENTPIKELMGEAAEEYQKSESTAIKDLKGKAAEEHQKSEITPIKDPKSKAASLKKKKKKSKAATKHHETQITSLAAPSEQKDERYLIVIYNVDMDDLMAIIAECRHENYAMVIVATTDFTEEINCNCRSSPALDKGADEKYLNIQVLEDIMSAQEIITSRKRGLRDELVLDYKESLSSFNLANCLLYFCMFPRHYLVRWNHLLMRYGAEGIDIHEKHGKSPCPMHCLKLFINQHAVQVKKNGEVKGCQLPVMMLDHISGESKSKRFLTLFCCSTSTTSNSLYPGDNIPVRRISLHPVRAEDGTLSLPHAKDLSRLRTLAVFHTGKMDQIEELSKYELLRVLDLKACTVLTNAHLKKICDLLLLKYLSLGDRIDEVPRKIAKLQWLETLNMTKTKIVNVPVEVIELPRIENLLGKFQLYLDEITDNKKEELLKKKHKSKLRRLSGFVIVDDKEFLDLMGFMVNLEKVKIWCAAGKWTDHVTAAIKKFIGNDPSKKLHLSIECEEYQQEIVKCLQHHGTLSSLKLHGDLNLQTHRDSQVERTIIHCLELKGIQVLCLSGTNLSGDEIVRVLKLFEDLKYLKLVEHKLGSLRIPDGCFRKLEQLCLVGVDTLHEIQIQAGALLRLGSLHMLFKEIELEGLRKPNLSGIKIKNLPSLTEIALYSDVAGDIKAELQGQASDHKKNPKFLFIQRPN